MLSLQTKKFSSKFQKCADHTYKEKGWVALEGIKIFSSFFGGGRIRLVFFDQNFTDWYIRQSQSHPALKSLFKEFFKLGVALILHYFWQIFHQKKKTKKSAGVTRAQRILQGKLFVFFLIARNPEILVRCLSSSAVFHSVTARTANLEC